MRKLSNPQIRAKLDKNGTGRVPLEDIIDLLNDDRGEGFEECEKYHKTKEMKQSLRDKTITN
jgi:hypothetical protein